MQRTLFILLLFGLASCGDIQCYSRKVAGQLVAAPASRLAPSVQTVQEKFALVLNPYTADPKVIEVAAGSDGLYIECLSTRCAVLQAGQCATFQCEWIRNWAEPSVIQCKMDKVVACNP